MTPDVKSIPIRILYPLMKEKLFSLGDIETTKFEEVISANEELCVRLDKQCNNIKSKRQESYRNLRDLKEMVDQT